jgi:hypothetical protein
MRSCRVCGADGVVEVLRLGFMPLANALVAPETPPDKELRYPLGLTRCPNCAIVQIPEVVPPDVLFRNYVYTPSASSVWRNHTAELAAWIRGNITLNSRTLVVEPASNDGCLLREIRRWAPRILGVEPALNIAEAANLDGIPTIPEFFSERVARQIRAEHGAATVIVGTNVLAHVPDLLDFLRGAAALLQPDGLLVVEAPYLRDLVESVAFDTIYHEHVSYFSVYALARAYERAGLTITHVERTPVHGGSIRFVGRPRGAAPDATVATFLRDEAELGYLDGSALSDFAERVRRLQGEIRGVVTTERTSGRTFAAYGATAKGNTLLGTCGITHDDVAYIVDRNPLKQGLLAPGTRIPIVGREEFQARPVDVLLVLAWNLQDEIIAQERTFAERGGRFLIPIPAPTFR